MKSKFATYLTTLAFILFAAIIFLTFQDYGISWDEEAQNEYGHRVVAYYRSFFKDNSHEAYRNLYLYGGLFDSAASLLNLVSPFGEFETRHLLNALVGMLGIVGAALLARRLAGARAGLLTALILMATPSFYGHLFTNPKDIPFATGYVWTIYFLQQWIEEKKVSRVTALKLGLALGLTLGVRVGGLVLLPYFALFGLLAVYRRKKSIRDVGISLGGAIVIAWGTMLVFWPWAQADPLFRPLTALSAHTHFTQRSDLLFDGRTVSTLHLPFNYLWKNLLIKLPPLLLALGVLGLLDAIWRNRRDSKHGLLPLAAVFPIAYIVARNSILYDEMRHLLFIVPPLAVLGGIYLSRLSIPNWASASLMAAFLGHQLWVFVSLHPYQYIYYNAFAGNLREAQHRYELDYWAESYAEAVRRLEEYLEASGRKGKNIRVAVCGPPVSAAYFFPENFQLVGQLDLLERASLRRKAPIHDLDHADYFIAFTRNGCHNKVSGREVVRIERAGALLSVVKEVSDSRARLNHPVAKPSSTPDNPNRS